jgi:hypothetical protein
VIAGYHWPGGGSGESDDPLRRQRHLSARPDRDPRFDLRAALDRARRPDAAGPGAAAAPDTREKLWIPLGPSTLVDGHTLGRQRVTGRVRDLWIDPRGERVYAATAKGGVWYSGDAGRSWSAVGGFAPGDREHRQAHRFSTGCLLVAPDPNDPDNPAADQVYVGTGELTPDPRPLPAVLVGGVGILVARGPAAAGEFEDPWTIEAEELASHGVYRLIGDGGGVIYAATSIGLRQRRPTDGGAWVPVDGAPFDTLAAVCTDVLWTSADGATPQRLWVWVATGSRAGLWYRDGDSGDFQQAPVSGDLTRRAALAASTPPVSVYVFRDQGPEVEPKLDRITGAGAGAPVVEAVDGIPNMVAKQGSYNLAVAVDPTDPEWVVLGGAALLGVNPQGTPWAWDLNGAIVGGRVAVDGAGKLRFGGPAAPILVGGGCHPDVHALRFTSDGQQLWAASDGGVARSRHPRTMVGFVSRNDGISAVEPTFMASHPICEGRVIAGLQDNGIIERHSSMVWRVVTERGDGGGVAFDPSAPERYVYQMYGAKWRASADSDRFASLLSSKAGDTPQKAEREDELSPFYVAPALIAKAPPEQGTQILLATSRLWYTDDWGATWVTLPSGSDPVQEKYYNSIQDLWADQWTTLVACAWATPDLAWVLGPRSLERLTRTGGDWELDPEPLLVWTKKKRDETEPIPASTWSVLAPDPSAPPGGDAGGRGGLYLGGSGALVDPETDTLWWYDGSGFWHSTGFRSDATEAPVSAVVCDPIPTDRGPRLFVGTGVGVWEGVRVRDRNPRWEWTRLVNGLPEATVEDLSLYASGDPSDPDSGTLVLLRAAVAARGMWELRLDADVEDLTYVRAHADDLRYRARALGVERDGESPRWWYASPDIVIRQAPVPAPVPAELAASPLTGTDLVVRSERMREPLQRFQAALRARMIRTAGDDRIEARGDWDDLFNEAFREFPGAEAADGTVTLTEAIWNEVMQPPDDTAEPWYSSGTATMATEADLVDRTIRRDIERPTDVSTVTMAGPKRVDVVVQHRGREKRLGSDVRVVLLRWTGIDGATPPPRYNDPSTWFSGEVPWTVAVNQVLNSPNGTTSEVLTDGWTFVDPATPRRDLSGQTLDNLTTGVATFDLDLAGWSPNTVAVLVAVIRAGADIALTPGTLEELVRTRSEVAARSLLVRRPSTATS